MLVNEVPGDIQPAVSARDGVNSPLDGTAIRTLSNQRPMPQEVVKPSMLFCSGGPGMLGWGSFSPLPSRSLQRAT